MSRACKYDPKFNSRVSEEKNQEAKKCFKKKEYHEAIGFLTEAINENPSAKYYCNRALAYFNIQDFKSSLQDCSEALRLDDSFHKAYARQHFCHVAEGDFGAALIALNHFKKYKPNNKDNQEKIAEVEKLKAKEEKLNSLMKEDNMEIEVISDLIDYLSRYATACRRFMLLKAECEARKANAPGVEAILQNLDPNDPEVLYLRGLGFYFQDKVDEAIKYMKNALIKLPDLPKAQKYNRILKELHQRTTEGKTSFGKKDFAATVQIFTKALDIPEISDLTKARLLTNRAVANHNLKNFAAEIEDCSLAIKCNPNSGKAYFQRASGYKNLMQYEEALFDFERVIKLKHNEIAEKEFDEIVKLLEEATKEHHQILHVSPNASKKEIRKSFLKLSKKYHPDHHKGTSKEKWFNQWYTRIQESNAALAKSAK